MSYTPMLVRAASVLVLAPVTLAQGVTFSAKTLNGLTVGTFSTPPRSIPPNTDVTAGVSLLTTGSNGLASASVSFSGQVSADSLTLKFTTAAKGGYVGVGWETATSGPNDVEVRIAATARTRVLVRVEHCINKTQYGVADLGFTLVGVGGFTYSPPAPTPFIDCLFGSSGPGQKVASYTAWLDSTPLVLRLTANALGSGLFGSATSGSVYANVIVRPDPDYPCKAVPFGSRCGAQLSFTTDFVYPGTCLLTIADTSAPSVWWLLLGDQKLQLPFGNCMLYDNIVVLLPMVPSSATSAAVRFSPPPIPGLYLVVQGATWTGTDLHFSEGCEVFAN
jgi:hypothetical protein